MIGVDASSSIQRWETGGIGRSCGPRRSKYRNSRNRPRGCARPRQPTISKVVVNIRRCGKHATSNRNSYVPLRPQQNGRLGAEPDTAINFEPLGEIPGGSFLSRDGESLDGLLGSDTAIRLRASLRHEWVEICLWKTTPMPRPIWNRAILIGHRGGTTYGNVSASLPRIGTDRLSGFDRRGRHVVRDPLGRSSRVRRGQRVTSGL